MRVIFHPLLLLLVLACAACSSRGGPSSEREKTAVSEVLGGAPVQGFARAVAPRRFRFPQDHGPHPDFRNEWWYFTGNLKNGSGRSFGYQLTFFRVSLSPDAPARLSRWGTNEILMAHFAVSDIDGRKFRYAERFSRAALGLAGAGGTPLAVRLEDWSAVEKSPDPWSMKLTAAAPDMAIELDVTALGAPVLNGEGGLSRKSGTPGNASYYYSIPRLKTSGVIRLGGESFSVAGLSWLDREWSTSALERDQVGWDWFALQLEDGRDLMFYRIRRRDGSSDPFSAGTLVEKNGKATPLRSDEVRLEALKWWKSRKTQTRYPGGWRIEVPSQGMSLVVSPKLADQELVTSFRYWEGAVSVRNADDKPAGTGYLEMTGY